MTVHCSTCTCPEQSADGVFCGAEATRGHETFYCIESEGHAGSHGGALVSWPPCPGFDGLDMHSETCPQMQETAEGVCVVRWGEAGVVETKQERHT